LLKYKKLKLSIFLSLLIHGLILLSLFFTLEKSDFIYLKTDRERVHFSTKINYRVSILKPKEIFKKPKNIKKVISKKTINDVSSEKNQELLKKQKTLLEDYIQKIVNEVERRKFYPPKAKFFNIQGVVEIDIEISNTGKILNSFISTPSDSHLLDHAATDLINSISSFPAFPQALKRDKINIIIPINYKITQ